MKFNRGIILAVILALVFLVVGSNLFYRMVRPEKEVREEAGVKIQTEASKSAIKEGETSGVPTLFEGEVLAGKLSPLLDFKEADYAKAIKGEKLVVLYFYADWCPICRAEFPKMQSAFNALVGDAVIGFRVNYKDNFTEPSEEALARQFGVAYQHTKVFVRNGERILKSPEGWDETRYLSEINARIK